MTVYIVTFQYPDGSYYISDGFSTEAKARAHIVNTKIAKRHGKPFSEWSVTPVKIKD